MKYKSMVKSSAVWILLCFLAISCARVGIGSTESKEAYMSGLKSLSKNKINTQLKADQEELKSIIEEADSIYYYVGFSFGFGGSEDGLEEEPDSADAFAILDADSIILGFNKLQDSLYFTQHFKLPHSGFEFDQKTNPNYLSDDFQYVIKEVDHRAVKDSVNVGLEPVKELLVQTSYSYPQAFDTLILSKGMEDSIFYKDYAIELVELDENELEMNIPLALSSKIIGRQAVTPSGILMNTNNYSSAPYMGVPNILLDSLRNIVQILKSAEEAEDKEEKLARISQINEQIFSSISKIKKINKTWEKAADKTYDDIDDFVDFVRGLERSFEGILGPKIQNVEVSYPAVAEHFYFYVATDTDTLQKDQVAVPEEFSSDTYYVFEDEEKGKSGVIDKEGNILVPATYERLEYRDENYFYTYEEDGSQGYFLNEETWELEALPKGVSYIEDINEELSILSKEQMQGVYKNKKEEIIPPEYEKISFNPHFIVGNKPLRGRPFYKIFTYEGKELEFPRLRSVEASTESNALVVQGMEGKYGLMDQEGELVIPMTYDKIEALGEDLYSYIRDYSENDREGIMNAKGEKLRPQIFLSLGGPSEERILFSVESEEDDYSSVYGYLDLNTKAVIPPDYDDANNFEGDFALVEKEGAYFLIDKEGHTVKTFDQPMEVEYVYDAPYMVLYLGEDGTYYDFSGKEVDPSLYDVD